MDRAQQWLHGRRRALHDWATDGPAHGTDELLTKALAGVDVLAAAGAIADDDAMAWRDEFRATASGRADGRVAARLSSGAGASAEAFLRKLLERAVSEDDELGPAGQRFEGAVHLLGAAGVVDPVEWNERERTLRGWPSEAEELELERELNAGGTQVELRRVYAGPEERRGGRRLLYVLLFEDGVSCLVDRSDWELDLDDWAQWRLSDDTGTSYMPAGGGGGDSEEQIDFRQAPPAHATWLELALAGDPAVVFRVPL